MEENNKKNKLQKWYEKHKNGIKLGVTKVVYYAGGIGLGYLVGKQLTSVKVGYGMQALHKDGFLKFFDPNTGQEVSPEAISQVIRSTKK